MSTLQPACTKIDEVIAVYDLGNTTNGKLTKQCPYGNGHINDTFLLCYETPSQGQKKYILQRMNHDIFHHPPELMENIVNITSFLRNKITAQGGDPDRETLNVVRTKHGANWYQDSDNNYWRIYQFIENSLCFEQVKSERDFYDSAVAFGNFQKMLADFPTELLYETIPNFHHTPSRFQAFKRALTEGIPARIASAQNEIAFALERECETTILTDLLKEGQLPLRVTHNDTKLNNILFDADTKKALCIIDLDTVMAGLSLYDFGDSIRFGANTAAEDETDLSKVSLDLSLFEAFTKGYLEGCAGSLTDKEIAMLPMGAKLMTYECGIRFLTDFLLGDTYFKIHRENHNLDRARTQFRLVADIETKWEKMAEIVRKYQ